MNQINKFYLASFLKNQIYFVPIMILFFQDIGLNYANIFWIFTIASIFSFIIEIPTGVFADKYGNRKSIILSKFLIFVSFIIFGLANNFIILLVANLIYELGKSFRSGTETAFIFNYLSQDKNHPSYTKIKINQKFYARISESIAALIGGFVAYRLGFNVVFFIAAVPAFINFIQTLSWEKIKTDEENKENKISLRENWKFIKIAFSEIKNNKIVLNIILNIAFFSASFSALEKFVQPYMKSAGVELQYFGVFYSAFLIIIALIVKASSRLEDKWSAEKIMNYSGFIAFLALIPLSLGGNSVLMVGLFFIVLLLENFRSPVANNLFHEQVPNQKRATMGSILELFKSLNKLWILPFIGYLADIYSMKVAILIISILILINAFIFLVPTKKKDNQINLQAN
ncbi:MAG: MFS transporter [Patescibacteria group bacterium]|nr:MFS transporter [Patescibacteria group bacterium]